MNRLVIVPTYNERDNIESLLTRLLALPYDLHVLVVDDGSPDGTGGFVREWSQRSDEIYEARAVGRKQLPSTVIGLLFHAAEHAQRHAAQIATTVKVVRGAAEN